MRIFYAAGRVMKVAVYARVSTKGQDSNEQQVNACLNFCKIKGWNEIDIFKEKESSVKQRPVFEELLRLAKIGRYQTIVMFRLDRGWRKSRQFIMDYGMLRDRGIKVISVMEGLDPTTPIGEATMTIIMALNQLERDNISMATKQRLDIIKNSKKLGRPSGKKDHDKRDNAGYLRRWAITKGDKKVDRYKPETIDLKNMNK
jgi:site-specific DNA recombinase